MAKTILVVDDSTSLRLVVKMTLEGAGYDVIEAADGQQALALLDGRKIHLVLSDLNMPVMNGLSLLAKIKQHPDYRFTPVIMLTTETAEHLRQQGRECGSCAWVVKPFEPPQLLDAIARLILP
ncbi:MULTISPECIES: response regulator [Aquitalea]|uniref:Two-component system chemotaxis response regulator CheY n=1 Tax=Aquitalea magnusonii TaxID=332411 RepID=A0A318JFV9_9NEIS|nr:MULTISPECIES: response regulator [Aquitalea]PXX48028.1 two-component system chemotaxis response regulator CheY [Aquitalea magnusonii]